MPGRGPQTFKKRQKEQERKERQQEKMAKRLARKGDVANSTAADEETPENDAAQNGSAESPDDSTKDPIAAKAIPAI